METISVAQKTISPDAGVGARTANVDWLMLALYVVYIVAAFFVYELSSIGSPVCFSDCFEYIELMQASRGEFFQTLHTMFRPWAVPTFFSLFGAFEISSAARIVLSQTYIAFLSWLLFAYACQGMFATRAMKLVGFVAVSSLMFGQGYYHFNQFLLSDSLAMSSVLAQYALVFLFPRFANFCEKVDHGKTYVVLYLAMLFIVTAFEMATRDANIMLGLAGVAFLILANRKSALGDEARWILVMFVFVAAFGQSWTAKMRYPVNAKNILAGAVFANEDMRDFFSRHGMPTSFDAAAAQAKPQSLDAVDIDEINEVKKKMPSAEVESDEKKFLGGVGGVYAMYFLTHPAYVIDNVARHWRLIFTQTMDLEATIDRGAFAKLGTRKFVRPGETTPFIAGASMRLSVADYIPPIVGAVLLALCALPPLLRPRDMWSFVPLFLAAMGVVNAILGFFGDVWERGEMERHAFIGSAILRLGLILCLLRLIEEARRFSASERPSGHLELPI